MRSRMLVLILATAIFPAFGQSGEEARKQYTPPSFDAGKSTFLIAPSSFRPGTTVSVSLIANSPRPLKRAIGPDLRSGLRLIGNVYDEDRKMISHSIPAYIDVLLPLEAIYPSAFPPIDEPFAYTFPEVLIKSQVTGQISLTSGQTLELTFFDFAEYFNDGQTKGDISPVTTTQGLVGRAYFAVSCATRPQHPRTKMCSLTQKRRFFPSK